MHLTDYISQLVRLTVHANSILHLTVVYIYNSQQNIFICAAFTTCSIIIKLFTIFHTQIYFCVIEHLHITVTQIYLSLSIPIMHITQELSIVVHLVTEVLHIHLNVCNALTTLYETG